MVMGVHNIFQHVAFSWIEAYNCIMRQLKVKYRGNGVNKLHCLVVYIARSDPCKCRDRRVTT